MCCVGEGALIHLRKKEKTLARILQGKKSVEEGDWCPCVFLVSHWAISEGVRRVCAPFLDGIQFFLPLSTGLGSLAFLLRSAEEGFPSWSDVKPRTLCLSANYFSPGSELLICCCLDGWLLQAGARKF